MPNSTAARVEKQIEREVSYIVQNKIKDNLGFITITGVKLTNDLSLATIYYSVINNDDRKNAVAQKLEKAKGFIRSELAKRLNRRTTPKLIFKYDESLDYGNKIERILKDINNKKDA